MKNLNLLMKLTTAIALAAMIGFAMAACDSPTSSDKTTPSNEVITYTLSFNSNGATGGTPPASKKAQGGDSVKLPGNTGSMTKEDAVFGGWNTKADATGTPYGAGSDFTMPNKDTTLYAKWNDDVNNSDGGNTPANNAGNNWSGIGIRPFTLDINDIAWGNDKFVAVGSYGEIASSPDGMNWTTVADSKFGTTIIRAITWGNNMFIAGGLNGIMTYSLDGTNWTVIHSTFGANTIARIVWGKDKFVAVGDGGRMAYSVDGINWIAVPESTFGSENINGIIWGNNKFVAVGNRGKMAYSLDGINWVTVTDSKFISSEQIMSITLGNNMFLAGGGIFGESAKLAYSYDGINWTLVLNSTVSTETISSPAWGNNRFVAGKFHGSIAYSFDGIIWITVPSPLNYPVTGIVWGNNMFVAVGEMRGMAYSKD